MTKERKHPKGLMVLFFTEMWERFGFYLIIGIFFLYMTAGGDAKFPGMGFSGAKASDIYGSYLALVYLTPFIGGLLADRYLGYRLSITIGGLLFSAGYFGLAIPNSENAFYISLLLIIMGNGLFKPNISALVGKIYDSNPKYKPLKDSGYNIFYMGINIGGFACNFIAAYLRINYGWGWAFAAAGVGMLIGVVWFWTGQTYAHDIKAVDKISPPTKDDMPMKRIFGTLFLPAIIAGFLGWIIPDNVFGSDSTDAFLFFSLVVVIFYINILRKARKQEKEPIKALLAVFGAVVIFWAIFHQNGAALTVWAEKYTDREMGKNSELIMSKLELTETASTAVRIVEETGLHGESKGYSFGPSYYYKNIPASDIEGRRADSILTVAPDDVKEIYSKKYIVNTIKDFDQQISEAKNKEEIYEITNNKEEWISAKDKWLSIIGISKDDDLSWANVDPTKKGNHAIIKLWPTELFQSINPGFIILFTPLVVGFFGYMARRRKKGPVSTPTKIGWGMIITALSAIVMIFAVTASNNGTIKASALWLFGTYAVITLGELCLSPMGLSLVSKLSPPRITALMMGGWFLSTSIGNKLSGVLSGMWDTYDNKAYFFLTNTLLVTVSVVLIFVMLPWLNRVMKKYTEEHHTIQEEVVDSEIE